MPPVDLITAPLSRRRFLRQTAYASVGLLGTLAPRASKVTVWHNPSSWGVEGKGWSDTYQYYDRLPARAQGVVRDPVWSLSRHSAGMMVQFETDAEEIHVRYELLSERLAMSHMPATGVSGLDLYGQDQTGVYRWVAVLRPDTQVVAQPLVTGLSGDLRRYQLYLPLYNGVTELEIGVEEGRRFKSISPRPERPIVFYGTSIMHGACASRPGMAFPSILSRRLDHPVINLGFSGNGRMEPEVAAFISELDAEVFVLDCLPNMTQEMVEERAGNFVRHLRETHPDTPIVLVEDRSYADAQFRAVRRDRNIKSREAFKQVYKDLLKEKMGKVSYVEGEQLLGLDGEATTDGSHPNDLGMMRYADALEPAIRNALSQS